MDLKVYSGGAWRAGLRLTAGESTEVFCIVRKRKGVNAGSATFITMSPFLLTQFRLSRLPEVYSHPDSPKLVLGTRTSAVFIFKNCSVYQFPFIFEH